MRRKKGMIYRTMAGKGRQYHFVATLVVHIVLVCNTWLHGWKSIMPAMVFYSDIPIQELYSIYTLWFRRSYDPDVYLPRQFFQC